MRQSREGCNKKHKFRGSSGGSPESQLKKVGGTSNSSISGIPNKTKNKLWKQFQQKIQGSMLGHMNPL